MWGGLFTERYLCKASLLVSYCVVLIYNISLSVVLAGQDLSVGVWGWKQLEQEGLLGQG